MVNSKSYLNVPYAEKDAAKALGGKWDAAKKKWYVPENTDLAPFAKWQADLSALESVSSSAKPKAKKSLSGVITYATDKAFVAYSGDEPPWL
mgnify:CR=1 FL=1